jgi:cobalamin biosynthesis Mg chelatase CobN
MTSAEETAASTSNDTDGSAGTESTVTAEESSSKGSQTQASSSSQGQPGLGRRILLTLGGIVIILSAGIGWLVGSNAAQSVARTEIFQMSVAIPTTPLSLSLYGTIVSALLISVLFGLVSVASRIEDQDDISVDTTSTDRDY